MKRSGFGSRQWSSGGKTSKFGSQSQTCSLGHKHNSVGEAQYCHKLLIMQRGGLFKSFQYEVNFRLVVNGKFICSHRPDFLIDNHDGSQEVHEYKGYETRDWLIKKNLFEALFPDIPYFVKTKKDLL